MNKAQHPKDMDIHFKNGVLRCKYCKREARTKWPMTLKDLYDGMLHDAIEKFKLEHTQCARQHFGMTS